MKRNLLFLFLFFCFLGSIVLGAELDKPPKLVVAPLINFDQLFVKLLDILELLFFQYMELFMGLFVVLLVIAYIQGILEDKVMRAERDHLARRAFEKARANNIQRQVDKQKLRERDLILRYVRDQKSAERVQHDIESDNWKDVTNLYSNDDLRVALSDSEDFSIDDVPVIDYEYYIDKVGLSEQRASQEYGSRATTYWRADGSEEGSERVKYRQRFHNGDDEDDYPRLALIEDDEDGY